MKKSNIPFKPLIIASLISTLLTACGESSSSKAGANFGDTPTTPTEPTTNFNQTALLANLADNVITPAYQAFVGLADKQQQQVANYCTTPNSANLLLAQNAWKGAMAKWQQIEMMQIGPLTYNSSTLRNNIYSWPITSSCGVDQDVMYFDQGSINGTPYQIENRTATRRGLDVIEYLLFNNSTEHSCTSAKDILADWPNKTTEQRTQLRCDLALEVAKDLTSNANLLVKQWAGDSGYAKTLKQAGDSNNPFATAHEGVNAVSDALFYLDKMAKDEKLGTPLGFFSNECGGVGSVCTDNVESPYSDNAINNLINNLIGFKTLFNGEGGDTNTTIGFDDYLIDVNDSETASKMLKNTQAVIDDLQSYEQSLATSITQDSEQAEASHAKIKQVTDQLKADFINSLALKLPQTAAGDND